MKRKAALLGMVVVMVTFVVGLSLQVLPVGVGAENGCPDDWWNLAAPEQREHCARSKAQEDRDAWATAQAKPYATTVMTPVDLRVWGTPVPPGFIPDEAKAVRPLSRESVVGIMGMPKNLTSVWRVGVVPHPDGLDHGTILVYAVGSTDAQPAAIGRLLFGNLPGRIGRQYNGYWESPRDIGEITITNVSGWNGIVSFTTSSGQQGTFNLATETWNFAS